MDQAASWDIGLMTQRPYTFERPECPALVRTFNALGNGLRIVGRKYPLDQKDIIRRARRRTGLHDCGDDYYLEALGRLTDAYECEAELTPFGRWFIREVLISAVRSRLLLQNYLSRNPSVFDANLLPPLIVVGMPRTGTTLLYNMLAQDPDARPLMFWETLQPAPGSRRGLGISPSGESRIVISLLEWLAPSLSQIHPVDPAGPAECTRLMGNTLCSPIFCMLGHIPSYENWLWSLDDKFWERVYHDYVSQLLVLQHQRGGGHWVLKSPVHLISVGPLLNAVPGAKVVFTDRDPLEVVPSACSLYAVFRSINSDHIDRYALGVEMLDSLSIALRRASEVLSADPARILRVEYRELTGDKINTIKRIYSHFGLPFTDQTESKLKRFLAVAKHTASHSYGLSQFGLSNQRILERFS
jgi:hypothetical protein